jgi:hypothetical protein
MRLPAGNEAGEHSLTIFQRKDLADHQHISGSVSQRDMGFHSAAQSSHIHRRKHRRNYVPTSSWSFLPFPAPFRLVFPSLSPISSHSHCLHQCSAQTLAYRHPHWRRNPIPLNSMATRYNDNGVVANAFGRRTLQDWKVCRLYHVGYMDPPDMRCSSGD